MRFFFTLLLLFCVCVLQAQQVEIARIKACAEGAENRTARLYLEDAITKLQWKVDEQLIEETGCFQFSVEIAQTQKAFIKIDFYQTFIFLQPGSTYNIIFNEFDFRIITDLLPVY